MIVIWGLVNHDGYRQASTHPTGYGLIQKKRAGIIPRPFFAVLYLLCVSICTNGSLSAIGGGMGLSRRRLGNTGSSAAIAATILTFSGLVSIMIRPLAARFNGSITLVGLGAGVSGTGAMTGAITGGAMGSVTVAAT